MRTFALPDDGQESYIWRQIKNAVSAPLVVFRHALVAHAHEIPKCYLRWKVCIGIGVSSAFLTFHQPYTWARLFFFFLAVKPKL